MAWRGVIIPRDESGTRQQGKLEVHNSQDNLRNSAWDVHKRVELIEDGDKGGVPVQEKSLKIDFGDGEEDLEEGVVLEGKNVDAMLLSQLSHAFASVS